MIPKAPSTNRKKNSTNWTSLKLKIFAFANPVRG
jgi:hypothetical protein